MGKYLRRHKVLKTSHEKVDNVEFSSIKLQFKKSFQETLSNWWLHYYVYQMVMEELIPILYYSS